MSRSFDRFIWLFSFDDTLGGIVLSQVYLANEVMHVAPLLAALQLKGVVSTWRDLIVHSPDFDDFAQRFFHFMWY